MSKEKATNKKNKAFKYRIYPTKNQEIYLINVFGCCRFIYNYALGDSISLYESTKDTENPEYFSYSKYADKLKPMKQTDEYSFLKKVDSTALQQALRHLDTAFQRFYKKDSDFPKFKAKRNKQSCTITSSTIEVGDNYIRIPKAGNIKAIIHRKAPKDYVLKNFTLSMEKDGSFYCSCLYEFEEKGKPSEEITSIDDLKVVGLDYKSDGFYVSSDGDIKGSPKYFRKSADKLAREQRRLSKKIGYKKGEPKSRNFLKQQMKVNKIYRHIANQRLDFANKASTEIANQYDIVCVETLNLRNMSNKGFGNGKATLDNGYGMFLDKLKYKLEEKGKAFVKIDKFFASSQTCSCCKNKQKMPLKIRTYNCPVCGNTIDRDLNAAINIRNEGVRIFKEELNLG